MKKQNKWWSALLKKFDGRYLVIFPTPYLVLSSQAKIRKNSISLLALVLGFSFLIFSGTAYSQGNSRKNPTEVELVTIRRTGFEPKSITRPLGKFVLLVQNRSGIDEVNLRLDRQVGDRLRDVRVRKDVLDWEDVLDLTPGDYVLTDANNPNWICRIKITPR